MRFSWTGLLLAPLLVPFMFSATMTTLAQGGTPWEGFLPLLFAGCIVSYAITIFLFLPCLFLLSLTQQMTGLKVCLLGLVLGAVAFLSLALIAWASAGPEVPIGNFLVFFLRWAADPVTAAFALAGLVTAGLYWWLGKGRTGRSVSPQ